MAHAANVSQDVQRGAAENAELVFLQKLWELCELCGSALIVVAFRNGIASAVPGRGHGARGERVSGRTTRSRRERGAGLPSETLGTLRTLRLRVDRRSLSERNRFGGAWSRAWRTRRTCLRTYNAEPQRTRSWSSFRNSGNSANSAAPR